MYLDQHTLKSMGVSRLIVQNAPAYEDYLALVTGREFRLAEPVEFKGVNRLLARFIAEKMPSGEKDTPAIYLWVEFNPAMGLFTVWGDFRKRDDNVEPLYKSSPRTGFDNELLSDPSRVFDWLDAAVSIGESIAPKKQLEVATRDYNRKTNLFDMLFSLHTAAGKITDIHEAEEDGVVVMVLEPEYRMPLDYYVSGTEFPGPAEGEPGYEDMAYPLSREDWFDNYADPVQDSVQRTLDSLYGDDSYNVSVDADGFVIVNTNIPTLKQESEAPKQESKSWFASEVLRMAGVSGPAKYAQFSLEDDEDHTVLDEVSAKTAKKKAAAKAKKEKGQVGPFSSAMTPERNALIKKLKAKKKAGAKIEDPEALAYWIGLRMAGKKRKKAEQEEGANISSRMNSLLRN